MLKRDLLGLMHNRVVVVGEVKSSGYAPRDGDECVESSGGNVVWVDSYEVVSVWSLVLVEEAQCLNEKV